VRRPRPPWAASPPRLGPDQLRRAGERLAVLLDQDGPAPTDADRARRRHLTLAPQQPDGMSTITGLLDPEARATLDAVLGKWAAPGMCNPDDDTACIDGQPDPAVAQRDTRSVGQRNHDGLEARRWLRPSYSGTWVCWSKIGR
jgi:Domain of unknown function (DUF222)